MRKRLSVAVLAAGIVFNQCAQDRPCPVFPKDLAQWPPNSPAFRGEIRAAIDLSILNRLDPVNEKRKVTTTTGREIHELYYEVLVKACRGNGNLNTYQASRQAAETTKLMVHEYFNLDDN